MSSQADNAVTFSFERSNPIPSEDVLKAAAIEGGAKEAPAESSFDDDLPVAETPPVAPVDAKSAVETPPPAGDSPKVHKIVVGGQELLVTEKDLIEGHMRHRDYTQKTQAVAEQARTLDAERQRYQTEITQFDQFLRDKQAMEAYMTKAFGPAPAAPLPVPQVDTSRPPTLEEVAQISRYNAEQVRLSAQREMDTRLAAAEARAQQASMAVQRAQVETQIDQHMTSVLEKFPVLKKFDGIEELLFADAQRNGPVRSLDDAKARLLDAAERRSTVIKALAEDSQKEAAIAAAKLKKNSPEPPGGSAPRQKSGKKLTLDYNDTKDRIASGVEVVERWLAENQ